MVEMMSRSSTPNSIALILMLALCLPAQSFQRILLVKSTIVQLSYQSRNSNLRHEQRPPFLSSIQAAEANASPEVGTSTIQRTRSYALSLTVEELGERLGGLGRARIAWDCYSNGIDPQLYFPGLETTTESIDQVQRLLPSSRRTQTLGKETLDLLSQVNGGTTVEGGIATLVLVTRSRDNTTKLLLKLQDGFEVETVLIPSVTSGRTTVCVSSQVGCRQGCTFCATGRMGKLRSLTSDEILVQLYFAIQLGRRTDLPPISNVVFMGMGEPGDNCDAVVKAAQIMTTRELFQLSSTRVTISTVAPTPETFAALLLHPSTTASDQAESSLSSPLCLLAWSVHAARDELRRRLVPTTKYSMVELRQGLIDALLQCKSQRRTCMLEMALIDHVNDSLQEADEMADFVREMLNQVPNAKIVVNLIPFNEIHGAGPELLSSSSSSNYRKPTMERVLAFQQRLTSHGIYARIRETRGDDESAACGQLATKKKQQQQAAL